jgi:hypothetical protein
MVVIKVFDCMPIPEHHSQENQQKPYKIVIKNTQPECKTPSKIAPNGMAWCERFFTSM